MAENNVTGIRPLDGLSTIKGMDAVDRRKGRKQRQSHSEHHQEKPSQTTDSPEATPPDESHDDDGEHTIDYCA